MTDDSGPDSEIKRTEWSQGTFIEVWENGEQKAAIPKNEALAIGKAAGAIPSEELEKLASAFESPWMARTEDEWHINKQRAQELRDLIAESGDPDD